MQFSAGSCVRFGWETFKKRPWFFIGVAAVAFAVSWIIGFLTGGIQSGMTSAGMESAGKIAVFVVGLLGRTLLAMGVTALYLKAHDDPSKADFIDLWHPQLFVTYLVTSVAYGLFVFIGTLLIVIPGIIVMLMFVFSPYVVIARSLGPVDAFKESRRITKGHRWELLILFILVVLLNILGAVCVLVGLLVTLPVTYLAFVHAYRTLEQGASEPAIV